MITLLVLFTINSLICHFNYDYWELVEIGLNQEPCFFVGILFGYLSCSEQGKHTFIFMLIALCVLYIVNQIWIIIPREYMTSLISIPFFVLLFSIVFSLTASSPWLKWINTVYKWFGKYTFEMYILHIFLWFIVKEVLHLGAVGNIVLAVALSILLAFPMHWVTTTICDWLQNKTDQLNKLKHG